jgi:type VI secretion system secreted protein VgrG
MRTLALSDRAMPALPSLSGSPFSFTAAQRLFELHGDGVLPALLVHTWSLREALNRPWHLQLSVLSPDAHIDPASLLGLRARLVTRLADGVREHARAGIVLNAKAGGSDGGLTRYTLDIHPWLSLLAHGLRSAVWHERRVEQIAESVFARYAQHAAWRWSPCALAHLAHSHQGGLRSYTVQYRESDLAFIARLLAQEGLVFRFALDEEAPCGHTLVILADTTQVDSCPEDATSAQSGGIRFHRAASQEEQDAIQALGQTQRLQAAASATLAWNYKTKGTARAHVPGTGKFGPNAPHLVHLDAQTDYLWADDADAQRGMLAAQQAQEARQLMWKGRSTVRTFDAGRQFDLLGSPLDELATLLAQRRQGGSTRTGTPRFTLTQVLHAGINELPAGERQRQVTLPRWIPAAVAAQAQASGYANAFEAVAAELPWKTPLHSEDGRPLHPAPYPGGPLTATVVGPNGETSSSGAQEIHTDRLGRIRIRFDFQTLQAGADTPETSQASTWVRVLQRQAGPGMGWHFIPRLGQEVLVDFMDARIDRPVVIAALYNGQGEAGLVPTPGGAPPAANDDHTSLAHSADHRPSGQGNRIGTGHSPAWHGAGGASLAAGGQASAAGALNGIKTQEFGGSGYNQLVFDDSPRQLRVQMATTQYRTQLNLGHLVHQADNHRGSLRGVGFELRSDAYGAIRGGHGVLITTHGPTGTGSTNAGQGTALPAFEHIPGAALLTQFKNLAQGLGNAARTHESTPLAAHEGTLGANQSLLAGSTKPEAPLMAWTTTLRGMADGLDFGKASENASAKSNATDAGKVPASTDPIVALHGRAGWANVAGADIHLSAADEITLGSGQDSHWSAGGAYRLHTGQAIGVLGGAIGPGSGAAGTGLTLIVGSGNTELQAQAGTLQIAAKDQVKIQSQSASTTFAAAKKITVATQGGASIVIEGGNITFACPGTITVKASAKRFTGPEKVSYPLPTMPQQVCVACLLNAAASAAPFSPKV